MVELPSGFEVHSPQFLASLTAASLSAASSSPCLEDISLRYRAQATPKLPTTDKTGFARRARDGVKLAAPRSALVLLLIIEVHAYFVTAVPWLWRDHAAQPVALVLGILLLARVLLGLVRVAFRDPGQPTGADSSVARTSRNPPHRQQSDGALQWCNTCKAPKPERSHHCSTCQRCVLKMDHHCVFVNTCIGQNNRQYFLRLLVDAVLALCLVQGTLVPQIWDAAAITISGEDNFSQTVVYKVHVCSVFVLGSVVLYMTTGLLLFHLQLVLRNETTIENLANAFERRKSPYDLGVLQNFTEAFGSSLACCPKGLLQVVLEALAWLLDDNRWEEEEDICWDSPRQPLQQRQPQHAHPAR